MKNNNDLLNELSKAMDSNPGMYIGDLIEYVVDRQHPSRKSENGYLNERVHQYVNYNITNQLLYDSLVKYNKTRHI